MENILAKLQEFGTTYGLKIVAAVLIVIVGRLVALGVRKLLRKIMLKSKVDETLVSFTTSLGYVTLLAFVIIAALGQLGIQTTSFVAIIGAAGLAIGLALQGSLANFAAGVLMIIFKPFKVGDFIEGGGVSGSVEEIGIFTTVMKSPDNKMIIVPNAKMTSNNIVNYTANDCRRVDIVAGVGYGDDLDKVRGVLEDILSADDRILKDPAPTIGVLELADSSVNFAVRPWVKTENYWDVFFATQESIKKRFDAEGISIPFPQQDVHLFKIE
ncbi:MAG: mechanosensitive ion channel [Candidatus Aegiribacteria sp.]|nr:mechanosensitive ion channel [Candidatus Aegiribacteria sp.]